MEDRSILIISAIIIILLLIGFLTLIYYDIIEITTGGEGAEIFCKNNGMELKDLESKKDLESNRRGFTAGNCVKIIDNQIVETREIVYIESINDWVFSSGMNKLVEGVGE